MADILGLNGKFANSLLGPPSRETAHTSTTAPASSSASVIQTDYPPLRFFPSSVDDPKLGRLTTIGSKSSAIRAAPRKENPP
jgi:hypothetical protein